MPKLTTKQGFKINYAVHGDSTQKETIILGNGNANSLEDWVDLGYVEKLSPYFNLILMDALGYGDSDKPLDPEEYTAERRAEDVIAVMNELSIPKTHFLGFSLGGSLGFVLADLYPERFLSFSIGSAHPYGSTRPYSNLFGEEFKNELAKNGTQGFVTLVETKYINRLIHSAIRDRYLRNDPQALIVANTPTWKDRSNVLSKIKVPVLVFVGANDPSSDYIAEMKEKMPPGVFKILSGLDHAQTYWSSDIVAPLVKNFIMEKTHKSPQSF